MDVEFDGDVIEWRGPAPYVWVRLPEPAADQVAAQAAPATYGWGAIPVDARIGDTTWETSLLPKDGGYVLPVKVVVRRAEQVAVGDRLRVGLTVAPRDGRRAGGTGPTC